MRVGMMSRAMLLLAATAMILVALTACGGGSAQEQAKPRILPEDEKALRPGEYRSEEFEPSLSFRVGKGWSNVPLEAPDVLHIERRAGWLAFTNVQQVFKPGTQGQRVEAPKDMVGWFQHHPYLQTSKPEPATVGGVKGEQFEVLVDHLPKNPNGYCGTDCLDIVNQSGGDRIGYFTEGRKRRVIVLEDVKGDTVVIWYAAPLDVFDEFAPEAQKVVDSVKWSGS